MQYVSVYCRITGKSAILKKGWKMSIYHIDPGANFLVPANAGIRSELRKELNRSYRKLDPEQDQERHRLCRARRMALVVYELVLRGTRRRLPVV